MWRWKGNVIALMNSCLCFETKDGGSVPYQAVTVTIQLTGKSNLDEDFVQEVSEAVVHYFKFELNRDVVTVQEFSEVLEWMLRKFGCNVSTPGKPNDVQEQLEFDLGGETDTEQVQPKPHAHRRPRKRKGRMWMMKPFRIKKTQQSASVPTPCGAVLIYKIVF